MSKHTKGPWKYNNGCISPDGQLRTLATVNYGMNEKERAEYEANAKLISAAPTMLEALEGLVNLSGIQAWVTDPKMKALLTERLNNAVEAINKATS